MTSLEILLSDTKKELEKLSKRKKYLKLDGGVDSQIQVAEWSARVDVLSEIYKKLVLLLYADEGKRVDSSPKFDGKSTYTGVYDA